MRLTCRIFCAFSRFPLASCRVSRSQRTFCLIAVVVRVYLRCFDRSAPAISLSRYIIVLFNNHTSSISTLWCSSEEGEEGEDIEMGEVSERENVIGRNRILVEDKEEGEASDESSVLSDPPDED